MIDLEDIKSRANIAYMNDDIRSSHYHSIIVLIAEVRHLQTQLAQSQAEVMRLKADLNDRTATLMLTEDAGELRREELARIQAQVAALRAALEHGLELAEDRPGHTKLCEAAVKQDLGDCHCWTACADVIRAALATDVGRGWLSTEQVTALKEAVREACAKEADGYENREVVYYIRALDLSTIK